MAKNIVYFLGAGASYSFGNPLTSQIMPAILGKLRENDLFQLDENEKTAYETNCENELLNFLYLLYPGLKNVKVSQTTASATLPYITEILSLVDHFALYNHPPHPQLSEASLTKFKDLLNRAVGELILEYDLKEFTATQKKLFDRFIRPIRSNKINNKCTIITTNYDLLIDIAFKRLLNRNKVDFGISYRNVQTSEIIHRDPNPVMHYYKLHGSLNWLKCELCGYYYINPNGHIIANAFAEEIHENNTCICNDTLKLKSVLVSPSFVRDIRDPNLLQIWKAATEAIRTADELTFIGYSLPPEDLGIKSILMRGLNSRDPGRGKLKVTAVLKGTMPRQNYLNVFGPDIRYLSGGIEAYLK